VPSDAYQNPQQPGRRREPDKKPPRSGERRPVQRAGEWTREHWRDARARLGAPRLRRPSRKAMTWTSAVVGLLVIAVAVLTAVWDWNWFRGPVARIASARMHRQVTISGDLRVHPFSWQPSATVTGVHVANPAWANPRGAPPRNLADIGRIALRIRLIPLLGGRLDMRLLQFDQPRLDLYRDAQGRATWDFSDGKNPGQPLKLPPIRDFVIHDGHITLKDAKHRLSFVGTLNASEQLGAHNRGFEMRGQGTLNAQPFVLQVTGGPLLNVDRARPYPFDAYVRAGDTYVTARGAAPKPFDLGRFYMNATARGPDAADLYGVTGIALPNTPPYDLSGRLSRDGGDYRLTGITGRVGSSDLSGELSANTTRARPFVQGSLHTRNLDFLDVGALFGGGAKVGKVASPTQVAAARALQAQQRLLPDATLQVDRIRSVDADVAYKADAVRDAPVNLSSAQVYVRLNAGVLTADPLDFTLPQGRIVGWARLDARRPTPETNMDLRLSDARLEHMTPIHLSGGAPLGGSLVGRVKLSGAGSSVRRAFANADGEMMIAVPSGEIRKAFAELMGVDVVKGLGLLLTKDQQTTPIRCGVVHFRAVNGVFNADQFVVDTGPVLVTGGGTINMATERLDLKVQGHPKKFQVVRLKAPITAQGTLSHPKLGVQPGPALAQGGVAAALGAFLSPLAAILPFIDPGLAKDANCRALLAEAGQHGAPATTARVASR
jgi:uncharacterized protein involved in outer membrane biogenesis